DVERRQDQDPALRVGLHDPPRGLEPVELGHPDVHEYDVRPDARGLLHRLEPVARLGDDLDVPLVGEQHPEPGPHHRLVVHHQYPDGHPPPPSGGGEARSTTPPEEGVTVDMPPPYSLTRSPIPISPCPCPLTGASRRTEPPCPSSRTSIRTSA